MAIMMVPFLDNYLTFTSQGENVEANGFEFASKGVLAVTALSYVCFY